MIRITGAASIGSSFFMSLNASWPFGSLSIDETQLCVSVLLRKVVIRKDEIRRIRLGGKFFWRDYHFELRDGLRPAYITFWAYNRKRVLVALEQHGWQVDLAASAQPRKNVGRLQ